MPPRRRHVDPAPAFKTPIGLPRPMDWTGLMDIHGAYERSAILHAAVHHDLFTHLYHLEGRTAGLPVPAAAVAAEAGTEPRATELLLNALTSLGLLIKEPPENPERPLGGGGYRTSADAQRFLVAGAEHDFRDFIRFDSANWSKWGQLAETVATGKAPAVDHMYQSDPSETKRFIDAMEAIGRARGDIDALTKRIDLSRSIHLIDIGGGSAAYSLAFLEKHRHLHVTLVDLAATLAVTEEYVQQAPEDVQRRIRLVPLDYNTDDLPAPPPTSSLPDDFVSRFKVPADMLPRLSDGYDVAWVSNILHGEDAAQNRALAEKLFRVLRPGGRVIIKEHILDDTLTDPPIGGVFAINMLLFTRAGRCYGFDEVRRWYEDAGFVDVKEIPPKAPLTSSLVTAKRPGGGLHEEFSRAAKLFGEGVSDLVRVLDPKRKATF